MDVGSNKSRKDTRAVVSLVARYRSPSTFEYVQEACCDVSVGGMFIKSTDPAAAGTLLKLECEADSSSDKIRGVARVVWLRRDTNEYGPSGMGVKFVKLEPGSRETITRIVQENSAAGIEPQSMSSAPESRGKPPGVHAQRSKDNGKSSSASAAQLANAPSAPQTPVAPPAPSPIAPIAAAAGPSPAIASPRPQVAAAVALPEVSSRLESDTSNGPARSSKPEIVAAAPRSAIDTRSASAVPQEPFAAPVKSGGVRVGWLIAVAVAALVLYLVTKKDTSVPVETSPTAPAPTSEPTTKTALPAPEAANEPTPTAHAQPEATPPSNAAQAAQPQADTAQPPAQEPAKPEVPAPTVEAAQAKPADQAPTPAAEKPAPEAPAAPATPPAASASDRPPLAPGQVPYIMSFVTRPTGASVTIGTQTIVAPGEMDLGAMPPRLKVTAQKEGYESSSVWLDRETEFVRSAGAMRRKVYLTLPALKSTATADAPKP